MGAQVAVIMGSKSDWPCMQEATQIMDRLGVSYEVEVVSAHRTPDKLMEFSSQAAGRGIQAGGAAHLPGMVASKTRLPVLGVPVQSKALSGVDSLYSIVQMPRGVAVGSMAIGGAGAFNAGLLASQILANQDPELAARIEDFRTQQTQTILDNPDPREG